MAEVQYMAGFIIRGNTVKKGRERKQDMRFGDGRQVLVVPLELNSNRRVFPQKQVTWGFLQKNVLPHL